MATTAAIAAAISGVASVDSSRTPRRLPSTPMAAHVLGSRSLSRMYLVVLLPKSLLLYVW